MIDKKIFELISIGTELTNGSTINTNGYWLAREIRKNGGNVNRITIISDELNQIKNLINEAIKRKPDYIVTTGGLGPTPDDKTFKGIAIALGLKTRINRTVANIIKQKCMIVDTEKHNNLMNLRLKMARLPEGAELILNNAGTAPGICLEKESVKIICLPGVPKEMKEMFKSIRKNIINQRFQAFRHKEINYNITNIAETSLVPLMRRIGKKYDRTSIYIKTHPIKKFKNNGVRIQIILTDKDNEKIKEMVSYVEKEIGMEIKNLKAI